MSQRQYDYLVFIGRFQPFHVGHKEVLDKALELADKVIVLVGSSNQPRTIKNPFTFAERKDMIRESYMRSPLSEDDEEFPANRIVIEPLRDNKYNDQAWAVSVQNVVKRVDASFGWSDKPRRGGIIGHVKDESSYYLELFPQWDLIDHEINEEVHATDIRQIYFESNLRYLADVVPGPTYQFLSKFSYTPAYDSLVREQKFIREYKKSWEVAPYAPTFLTCDAVVVQSGHILLIKRKAEPGRGLWALPGGFVNPKERIEDGMIRELREETKIKVPGPVLRGSIKAKAVFDHPDRSLRGRTVTQAYYIELPPGKLPLVKGGDDAASAKWVPLAFVKEEEMFEDHYSIKNFFLGE